MEKKYYIAKNDKVYEDYELIEAAYIGRGISITVEEIKDNMDLFPGIVSEIVPDIESLIDNGQTALATKLYRERNKVSLKEAYDTVKTMYIEKFK